MCMFWRFLIVLACFGDGGGEIRAATPALTTLGLETGCYIQTLHILDNAQKAEQKKHTHTQSTRQTPHLENSSPASLVCTTGIQGGIA